MRTHSSTALHLMKLSFVVGAVIASATNWADIPCEWVVCKSCDKVNATCTLGASQGTKDFCGASDCDPTKCKSIYAEPFYCVGGSTIVYKITTNVTAGTSCDQVNTECF